MSLRDIISKKNYRNLFTWKRGFILLLFILIFDILFMNHTFKYSFKDIINELVGPQKLVSDNIVFLGDSITERYHIDEFYEGYNIVNSGIGGNQTIDISSNMKERLYRYNPSKVFLLIGTNDLNNYKKPDEVAKNIDKIIKQIKKNRPYAEIYVESIFPVNNKDFKERNAGHDNKNIKKTNKLIISICKKNNVKYLDIYKHLIDNEGNLKKEYSEDGLHLTNLGYLKLTNLLLPYINEK